MVLDYSYLEPSENIKAADLQPIANGGLYTGVAFSGPWGNYPSQPDATYMVTKNLATANPPPGAMKMVGSDERPGNNSVLHPYHVAVPNQTFKAIGN